MTELRRSLSLHDLVLIGAGGAIGSGIFRSPSLVAAAVPSSSWVLAAWALGGAVTLAGGLTYAELGAAVPGVGGQYSWLREAYGDLVAFLFGWAYLVVVVTGAIAALAVIFAEYVAALLPMGPVATRLVALAALALLAGTNVMGVKLAAALGNLLTLLKLGALAAIVGLALLLGRHPVLDAGASAAAGGASGLGAAMIGVLWSYGGWQHASFVAAEAKRPERDVPLGMILGTATVTGVYLVTNVAYLRLLPLGAISSSQHVASDAVTAAIGPAGGALVAAGVATSALGTAGVFTLTAPRLLWAVASRVRGLEALTKIDPRWQTPARAIVAQTAWAMALVIAWGTFERLISYVLFVDWIFFGLTGAAVVVMRRRRAGARAAYRVPGYPVVPLLFVGASAWFVASTLASQPWQAVGGACMLAAGAGVYGVAARGSDAQGA